MGSAARTKKGIFWIGSPSINHPTAGVVAYYIDPQDMRLSYPVVTAGYVTVNTVFGNIIEPNLMGRRLGLSTLVVILSLLFWGWAWGPMGALLSVPLTVIMKIWLENTTDLEWLAVLLAKTAPDPVSPTLESGD